jgi:ABC-type methionine transport system ATPase subunit
VARTTVRLTFRGDSLTDPVIYRMGKDFRVVTNIRRADVGEDHGWVELEIDGDQAELDRALEYCRTRGVAVERLQHHP